MNSPEGTKTGPTVCYKTMFAIPVFEVSELIRIGESFQRCLINQMTLQHNDKGNLDLFKKTEIFNVFMFAAINRFAFLCVRE